MELTIKHLSGSRSGQTQRLSAPTISVGRNPSNLIAFDPESDRAVSGNHAELQFRNGSWWIRDLGSSNGTWVNGERVTDRMIRPGEVVQFGTNGPKLQLDYDSAGPIIPDIPIAPGAPEGRTVMMMVGGGAPAAAAPSSGAFAAAPPVFAAAPPKKKGGALRTILIVFFLLAILGVLGIGAMVFLGGGSKAPVAEKPAVDPAVAAAAAKEAEAIKSQIEAAKASMAQTQENLLKAQNTTATTTAQQNTTEAADMQRQLAESQRLIDELARQLQEKNDLANQQQAMPPPKPQQPQKKQNLSDAQQLQRVLALQAAKQQAAQQPVVTTGQPATTAPAKPQTASAVPVGAQQAAMQPVVAPAQMTLSQNKRLKRRIRITAEENEIPLADLPDGAADDVAGLIITALKSMGDVIPTDTGEDGAITVVVTNFKDRKKTTVNTESVANTIGSIAGIAGGTSVSSPANLQSGSRDSEMSVLVRMFDRGAVQIGQTEPSAAAKSSKTQFTLSSITLGQEAASGDNPLADVTRKVVADAVDALRNKLDSVQWTGLIEQHEPGNPAMINCGTMCGLEVGDVFDVLSAGRPVGRVKVTFLDSQGATAEVISGSGDFTGKTVRFAGRETESAIGIRQRSLQMREKAKVYAGPGRSFREVKELAPGTRVRYLYSVGVWAKATDGSSTFWVHTKSAQVVG